MTLALPDRSAKTKAVDTYIERSVAHESTARLPGPAPSRVWLSPLGWVLVSGVALAILLFGIIAGVLIVQGATPSADEVNKELVGTIERLADELAAERETSRQIEAEADARHKGIQDAIFMVVIAIIAVLLGFALAGSFGAILVLLGLALIAGVQTGVIDL